MNFYHISLFRMAYLINIILIDIVNMVWLNFVTCIFRMVLDMIVIYRCLIYKLVRLLMCNYEVSFMVLIFEGFDVILISISFECKLFLMVSWLIRNGRRRYWLIIDVKLFIWLLYIMIYCEHIRYQFSIYFTVFY